MRGLIAHKNILYYSKQKELVIIRYKYKGRMIKERLSVFEFMARIIQHIDSEVISTRYYGIYSNRIRNKWKKEGRKVNKKSLGMTSKDAITSTKLQEAAPLSMEA